MAIFGIVVNLASLNAASTRASPPACAHRRPRMTSFISMCRNESIA